ncbi:MAG: Rrf2 family transcriptional regulator [Bacteroidetes bacterium]|nr:Rrf2 family transcriptional regulator [Bacteroidota bacterium]
MLSITCKAAIKSVLFITTKEKTSLKEIAKYINENEHTVGKLLQKLVKEKIINSSKGPNGGFYITEKQSNQAIVNIVYAIDGKEIFKQCALGLSKCSESKPCPLHNEYKNIREQFTFLCNEKRICDLNKGLSIGKAFLVN